MFPGVRAFVVGVVATIDATIAASVAPAAATCGDPTVVATVRDSFRNGAESITTDTQDAKTTRPSPGIRSTPTSSNTISFYIPP